MITRLANSASVAAWITLKPHRVWFNFWICCWNAMNLRLWFLCFWFQTFDFDLSWVIGSSCYLVVGYYRVSRFGWQSLFWNPTASIGVMSDHVISVYLRGVPSPLIGTYKFICIWRHKTSSVILNLMRTSYVSWNVWRLISYLYILCVYNVMCPLWRDRGVLMSRAPLNILW